ncbi:hypothetical protein BDZ45DRAFT_779271 [Acephala macrosclerotiorum]|nr:hypothetical protein BDZ45DRAFT_779271 [Acephala macrosclerotiorum]
MLHFGSEQLFWECDEMTACETYPAYLTINDPVRLHTLDHGKNKLATDGLSSDMQLRHRLSSWYGIVGEYSTKQLTKSGDKLIALSGIAQQYAEFWVEEDDRYLAGLWRSDISDGLLWKTDGTATRAKKWRAPSWSWASLDGEVQLGLRSGEASDAALEGKQLCEVHEAQIELVNKEYPFGALESAVLPIQGKIVPAVAVRNGDGYCLAHEGSTIPRSTWFPDETPDGMPQTNVNVLCLVVKKELSFDRERTIMGLTVELKDPRSTGQYVRTGCFVITANTRRELYPDTPFRGFIFEDVKLTEKDLIKLL